MGEERNYAQTADLLKKWIGDDGVKTTDIDCHAKLVEGCGNLMSEFSRDKRFIATLDTAGSAITREEGNAIQGCPCTPWSASSYGKESNNAQRIQTPKLGTLQNTLVPSPKQRRSPVRVERLDLDGLLDFNPRDAVLDQTLELVEGRTLRELWEQRRKGGSSSSGSFVLELIVDPTFTSDEVLSTSNALRAIIELKWSSMGQLAWFRFGLTWLGAISFTAFSGLRQYTEYGDYRWLMVICVVLSAIQILVLFALIGWMWRREVKGFLRIEGLVGILLPFVGWGCVAAATGQALWLLNCLSTLSVHVEAREAWMRHGVHLFTSPWSLVTHDPLSVFIDFVGFCRAAISLVMIILLLSGLVEPDSVFGTMSILTFLFWLQIAKEVRGRRVFGVYISLIHGVLRSTLPFLLLCGLGVMALTFAWWVLSMQRPDAHYLQEEDSVHCVETPAGLTCGTIPQSHDGMITRLWAAFTFSYRAAMLGDYPGDAFALADYTGGDDNPKIGTAFPAWVFFFCATYIHLIVLLNLLIAIMNSRFEDLMTRAYAVSLRQRARVCLEFERTVQSPLTTRDLEESRMVFSYTLDQRATKGSDDDWKKAATERLEELEKASADKMELAAAERLELERAAEARLEKAVVAKLEPLTKRLEGLEKLETNVLEIQKSLAALANKMDELSASRPQSRSNSTPL